MKKHVLIGKLLVECGAVQQKQVEDALELQKHTEKRLGEILVTMGYVDSPTLTKKLGDQVGIPFIELKPEIVDKELVRSFSFMLLYENDILPLYEMGDKLHVAIGDPTNQEVVQELKKLAKKRIVLACAEPLEIKRLLVKECY